MNNVTITSVKNATGLVNKFTNSPDKGYLLLSQSKMEFIGGWASQRTRTALLKGELTLLEQVVREAGKSLAMPGKIVVQEFVQSAVPQAIKDAFFNENLDEDANFDLMAKRTGGANSIDLTLGGERIMRVSYYSANGEGTDIAVAHDNGTEIKELRAHEKSLAASLPGGGN